MIRDEILKKLDSLSSNKTSEWEQEARERKQKEAWLRKSQMIAVKILRELRIKDLSQKQLADKMGVTPQTVNKWVKGKENFTLETIAKIESAIGISLNVNEKTPPTYKNKSSISISTKMNLKISLEIVTTEKSSFVKSKGKILNDNGYKETFATAS